MDQPGPWSALDWIAEQPELIAAEALAALRMPEFSPLRDCVVLLLADLEASVLIDDPELLAEQLRWLAGRLSLVEPTVRLDRLLDAVVEVVGARLGPQRRTELEAHVALARGLLAAGDPAADEAPPSPAGPPDDLSGLAGRYLGHLLDGEREAAIRIVMDAAERGEDAGRLLLEVLQPAQLEVGRLWERGEVSVAQEHFTTSVTQMVLSLLHPYLARGDGGGRRLVAAGVGFGSHEVGIRMVTEFLERAGWTTTYLGTSVPAPDVVEEVVRHRAHVLALTASLSSQIGSVRRLIEMVRADPRCAGVKVVVGGRMFGLAPALAREVDADGYARDAAEAVAVCDQLVPVTS